MKRRVPFTLASLLLGGLVFVAAPLSGCTHDDEAEADASSNPRVPGHISVDQPTFDFGKVVEGQRVKHSFTLTNQGKGTLHIQDAVAPCGCIRVKVDPKVLAPGAKARLEAVFDTSHRVGPNTKSIRVKSDDPSAPVLILRFKGLVERRLGFRPAVVRFATHHGEKKAQTAWLEGVLAPKAKLKVLRFDSPASGQLSVTIVRGQKAEKDGVRQGVRIEVAANKLEKLDGTAEVATGLSDPKQLSLTYHLQVVGNVRLERDRILVPPASSKEQQVKFRVSSRLSNFRLVKARVLQGPFVASVKKAEEKSAYFVVVERKGPTSKDKPSGEERPGKTVGKILLLTNDRLQPKIELPIVVRSHAVRGKLGLIPPLTGMGMEPLPYPDGVPIVRPSASH